MLGRLCQRLQEMALQAQRPALEVKLLRAMLDDAMNTRLAIYDHCLEIQTQFAAIMSQLDNTQALKNT